MAVSNGITALINLSQLKQTNANEAALDGADKQRDIIKQMKDLRGAKRAIDDKVRDKVVDTTEQAEIRSILRDYDMDHNFSVQNAWSHDDGQWEYSAKLGEEGSQKSNQDAVDALKQAFDDKIKDLEAEDKLGNFEVQDLMSTFNQNQTLASNIQKKRDDTESAIIGKV